MSPRCGIEFDDLIAALGAAPSGDEWKACCPAHDDRHPSLSIRQEDRHRVLLHCFAGCTFEAITGALAARGLWPVDRSGDVAIRADQNTSDAARTASAWEISKEARLAIGTKVEHYLRARGITLPLPEALRYQRSLRHRTGTHWPAMIASVVDVRGVLTAVHRTWLNFSDPPRKAPIEPNRMLLGPSKGCAVRLAPPGPVLLVGEGIETTMSGMQASRLPGWAAVSAGNMPFMVLPEVVREVIILADADAPGEAAALKAAQRWKRSGLRVFIARPPAGHDFNDLLQQVPA